jgi:hypothetical protein
MEYEAFADQRRALLEAEGQAASDQALEQAAKILPKRANSTKVAETKSKKREPGNSDMVRRGRSEK